MKVAAGPSAVPATGESLAAQGIRQVALTFVDNAGITRARAVPVEAFDAAVRRGIGISPSFVSFASDDHVVDLEGVSSALGDMRLVPAAGAAVALSGWTGWGWAPVDHRERGGQALETCSRSLLQRVCADLAATGSNALMAFEVEFTLLGAEGRPLHTGPGYGIGPLLRAGDFFDEAVSRLHAQGIPVAQVHTEYADGQYEISVPATDPLAAADQYVLLRLTLRRLAADHGLEVAFGPIVVPGAVGNGCHLHASLWRGDVNLLSGGTGTGHLTDEGQRFVAGVLRRLAECTALYAPSVLSSARLQPSHWAGAYACWGVDNREAALRLVGATHDPAEGSANVELKTVDGTANPYLAAATMLASGMDGLADGCELPPPAAGDPGSVPPAEGGGAAVRRLPSTPEEALTALEASSFARGLLGSRLHDAYCAVRRYEAVTYASLSREALAMADRQRYG